MIKNNHDNDNNNNDSNENMYYCAIATISYLYNLLCFLPLPILLPFCPMRQLAQSLWAQVLSSSADLRMMCRMRVSSHVRKKEHTSDVNKTSVNMYNSFMKL